MGVLDVPGYSRAQADAAITVQARDAQSLARLAVVGATDRDSAQAAQRVAFADNPGFTEEWANLSGWASAAANAQVSAGKLYGNGGSAGVRRGIPNVADLRGVPFHATGTFVKKDATPVSWLLGLTTGTAADGSDVAGAKIWGIYENAAGQLFRYTGTEWGGGAAQALPFQYGVAANAGLPAGTYYWSIESTAFEATVTVVNSDMTVVASAYAQWSGVTAPVTGIALVLFDSRGTSGNAFGPVVMRQGRTTTGSPRGSVESQPRSTYHRIPAASTGQFTSILTPANMDSRRPVPVILYCHGYNENIASVNPAGQPAQFGPTAKALADAGFMVVASDLTGLSNWGNAGAITALQNLYQYLVANFPVGQIGIIGHSMGSLAALTTIAQRILPNIAAAYMIEPACNLRWLAETSSYAAAVKTAHGLASDLSDYATKTAGLDPLKQEGWRYRGMPMRVVASPQDTQILKTECADKLVALVSPYSTDVTTLTASGGHTNASHFVPSDVVAFFRRTLAGGLVA